MAAMKGFNYIRKRMYTTESYGLLQNYIKQKIRHLVALLGWGVGDNYGTLGSKGNLQQRFLRTLTLKTLCENGDEEAVSQAVTLFDNWLNKDEEIPADLKSFVYFVGVMKGDSEVWDTVWRRQEVSSHADDAHTLRQALAASQYPWVLWRFMEWSLDSTKVRMQYGPSNIGSVGKTHFGQALAFDFIVEKWDVIRER
ncbi:aminopeptidase N-like [Ptychodera flava]|uniref:aminopeptidase N-like n=1 Tax=Ptychodera flava TaxID=63121 RepID=UPI003969C780